MTHRTSLSGREVEAANLLLEGKSNKEIALQLGLSVRTVEFHITNILRKLNVSSRAEAIVKLSEIHLRIPAGGFESENLRESTVENRSASVQNVPNLLSNRSAWMNQPFSRIVIGLFAVVISLGLFLFVWNAATPQSAPQPQQTTPLANTQTITATAPSTPQVTNTPSPAPSARALNVMEARRLAEEYDRVVKEEIGQGNFESSLDARTGKTRILFQGNAQEKIAKLYDEFAEKLFNLNKKYLALYVAEVKPTPYPTKTTQKENSDYHQTLVDEYLRLVDEYAKNGSAVQIYDPSDGFYYDRLIGDAYAQSEAMLTAMEALLQAPLTAKVDQGADADLIRAVLKQPDLQLNFVQVGNQANAPWIKTAFYEDPAQNRYSVAIGKRVLVSIVPGSRPNVPAVEVKPVESVRQIAEAFVRAQSPNFVKFQNQLVFEQGGKGDIYFFTWRLSNRDWSKTPWKMMAPFLQVGMSADGKLVTLVNTLDLFEE